MKNKLSVWVLSALTVFAALTVTGCFTTTQSIVGENTGNFGEHTRTPVKDFVSLGLIFTETQLTSSSSEPMQGQVFTYQALLMEAHKLGADAIINVVIDKKTQKSSSITSGTTIETWYGSALAIKYTETIRQTETVTVTTGDTTTTTQSSSVVFNDGLADNSSRQNAGASANNDSGSAQSVPRGIRQ